MLTPKENLLSLYNRKGFESQPVGFILCPSLEEEFKRHYPEAKSYQDQFNFPYRIINDPGFSWNFDETWRIPERNVDWHSFYPEGFTHDAKFDGWGVIIFYHSCGISHLLSII